ncbi:hypothetical protein LCGC14_3114130, partial [marine sediment metagenome]
MHGHDNCSHGPARAWVMQPDRRWFARCDTCNVFRLWADYYEVYGVVSRWWWECECDPVGDIMAIDVTQLNLVQLDVVSAVSDLQRILNRAEAL